MLPYIEHDVTNVYSLNSLHLYRKPNEKTMKTKFCRTAVYCLCCFMFIQPITGSQVNDTHEGVLHIDKQKTRKVSRVQYGFHYEEIGMIGEGALHANWYATVHSKKQLHPQIWRSKMGFIRMYRIRVEKTKMYFM